jgi:hypothetical protein
MPRADQPDQDLVRKIRVDEPKFCPYCGMFSNRTDVCANCGTSFDGTPPVQATGEEEVWRGHPDPILSPLAARMTTYIVTTERVIVSSDVLTKSDSVDLFRVKEVRVEKKMQQRLRGVGTITIIPSNTLSPELVFQSVPQPDNVAETIRRLVAQARKGPGTIS